MILATLWESEGGMEYRKKKYIELKNGARRGEVADGEKCINIFIAK